MKRNKTQASDQYVVISTPGTLCEGYSMPYIKQFNDYGVAFEDARKALISLCSHGYTISSKEDDVKHDSAGRRVQWHLTCGDDEGWYVQIIKIEPYEIDFDKYSMPKYLAYDQIYNSHDWLYDYVECRCHVASIAMNSRGFDQDFMKFKELTAELYEHVFIELDDMDEGQQSYVTLDDDDVCIHYFKIKYDEQT